MDHSLNRRPLQILRTVPKMSYLQQLERSIGSAMEFGSKSSTGHAFVVNTDGRALQTDSKTSNGLHQANT